MLLNFTPLSLIAAALAVIAMVVAVYSWRHSDTFGSGPLLLLALIAAGWSLAYGLEVASTTESFKLLWAKVQWIGLTLAPVLWLACAARGTSNGKIIFGHGRWLLWLIIPALILALAWTNEWHGLVWKDVRPAYQGLTMPLRLERGTFFWLDAFFALGLCLLVTMMATAAVIRLPMFRRRYAGAVLLGTALPWLGNMLYLSGVDLAAPVAYLLGGLMLSWGLYQIRSLNLVPIARSAIVENMPDGMLVLDDKDRVLDCNPAALQLLRVQLRDIVGRPAAEALHEHFDLVQHYSKAETAQDEIVLNDRICELRIAPMTDRLGRPTGRLIMVRDVTEQVRSADELDQRTAELQTILQAFPDLMFRLDQSATASS